MSRATEIYPYKKLLERELQNIRKDPINSDTLLHYYQSRVAEGISIARTCKCLYILKIISKMIAKRFEDATKDDLVNLVATIERRDISAYAKRDYKIILKQFYRWLRNCEEGSPPEVRWMKISHTVENRHPIIPKNFLTLEEKQSMLRSAGHPQERALLEVFFETGRRLGEILTLHIKDVEFDSVGAKLFINGKVGEDFARVISSTPSLAQWVDLHPMKEKEDAPLWIGFWPRNYLRQMSYAAARSLLISIAKRAGVKKRIFYYLVRHTRIDETQGLLTEAQQCMMFGWKFGSKMPGVYMKKYGKHIDNAQAIMNGVIPRTKTMTIQKPKECIRCKTENSPTSRFCNRCGESLEIKFGVEVEDRKKKIEQLLDGLLKDPKELENLRSYLAERRQRPT